MLCKVTHCAGRVSANTRPHQLRWGDWEMGTAIISCVECSQVAGLIQKVGRDSSKSTSFNYALVYPGPVTHYAYSEFALNRKEQNVIV